jgi:hypothetical protein
VTTNILLTHQSPGQVARMLDHWSGMVDPAGLWVAYGGKREAFDAIDYPRKFFLESDRIRVRDLQRDRQGYHEVFRKAAASGVLDAASHVHLAEFDQYPVAPGVNERQRAKLEEERADAIFYRLERLDGTHHPHYLSHTAAPEFHEFLRRISIRPDRGVTLSALGFGSFWRKEAFAKMAAVEEPFPIYLELFIPTVAHHIGCRVRPNHQDLKFTPYSGDASPLLEEARGRGAWFIHPWKTAWNP